MEDQSDKQLISGYLAGEEALFAILVERYLTQVVNFINTIVANRQIAEELTQEAFVKAWKSLKKFDLEKNFKTWILAIAKNTAIDYLRKKKLKDWEVQSLDDEAVNLLNLASPEPLPDEYFSRLELEIEVRKLVAELKPLERGIINLHYQEQLTFEEISEVLGLSVNTIKSLHRRLLIKLRKKI